MFIRLLIALALLVGGVFPATAQDAPSADALAARFAEDAAKHVRDLRDLYATRGVREPRMEAATLADVVSFIATNRSDSSPGYPQGSAVLFYAHEGERLAIYLIGQQGLIAYHETAISPANLRMAGVNYRIDLDVDGIARSRAPVWTGKGAPPAQPAVSTSRAGRYTPIADILLPPAIRKALLDVRHLVIVAGGVIATNPFAAFPLTGDEVLIDRMSVTVSAGLFDLDQMLRPWRGRSEYANMLLVGDPRVPTTPEWRVKPLPGAASEAALLAERAAVHAL